ncbi:MAG: GTPase [Sedimentisphaerales bacterium]
MYNINDTIVAVSSGSATSVKKIVRVSGDKTFDILKSFASLNFQNQRAIIPILIDINEFELNCCIYLFCSPNSYTGEDLAEIHLLACGEAFESVFSKLLSLGCRNAEPGEFTYRAYINGKMDLSCAEAVAQVIQSSNQYQLSAAQRLFSGSIEKKISQIRTEILNLLSLIEAGLDFSTDDIEIISAKKAIEAAEKIKDSLKELLDGSITYEQITQAPSVVIAGAANAGKSSLVNALVGAGRSIVSDQSGTTRDVLEHWLKLEKCDCVLFDCAGLVVKPADILQTLANEAALKAINDATIIIFCVDITKKDYLIDLQIFKQLKNKTTICITAKCDLLSAAGAAEKLKTLKDIFAADFIIASSKTSTGLNELKKLIEQNIIMQTSGIAEAAEKTALTERHRKVVIEAIKNIENASGELKKSNEEIAAFTLRSALQNLSGFEPQYLDEKILETIFSRFCIGK